LGLATNTGSMPELGAQLHVPLVHLPCTAHRLFAHVPGVTSTVTVALPSVVAYVKVSLPVKPSLEMYLTVSAAVALAKMVTLPPRWAVDTATMRRAVPASLASTGITVQVPDVMLAVSCTAVLDGGGDAGAEHDCRRPLLPYCATKPATHVQLSPTMFTIA
jgi:hypothetical protein